MASLQKWGRGRRHVRFRPSCDPPSPFKKSYIYYSTEAEVSGMRRKGNREGGIKSLLSVQDLVLGGQPHRKEREKLGMSAGRPVREWVLISLPSIRIMQLFSSITVGGRYTWCFILAVAGLVIRIYIRVCFLDMDGQFGVTTSAVAHPSVTSVCRWNVV